MEVKKNLKILEGVVKNNIQIPNSLIKELNEIVTENDIDDLLEVRFQSIYKHLMYNYFNYAEFIEWVIFAHPEYKNNAVNAVITWCGEYELECFVNLTKEEQLEAIIDGSIRTGFNSYIFSDLLEIYRHDFDDLLLEKIATPIEIAKLIGEFNEARNN